MLNKRKKTFLICAVTALSIFFIKFLNIEKGSNNSELLLHMENTETEIPKTATYAETDLTYGSLKIIRENSDNESNGNQVFVYKITDIQDENNYFYTSITGNGSVTIEKILCREYQIQQMNDWSWRYSDEPQNITVTESGSTVTFSGAPTNENLLNGNGSAITNSKKR